MAGSPEAAASEREGTVPAHSIPDRSRRISLTELSGEARRADADKLGTEIGIEEFFLS